MVCAFRGFLVWAALVVLAQAHNKQDWKSRSIYQILTDRFSLNTAQANAEAYCPDLNVYCGGTWQGIQTQLDYIQGMGFNAIWISPITAQTTGGYHGYWQKNLYSLNENFGTAQDLINLVNACHERDIWVMVDVVFNHMGYPDAPYDSSYDFAVFPQFGNTSFFHIPDCDIDYSNQTSVETCWIDDLPDLKQENPAVTAQLLNWITYLITTYNIDGLRIDTVKHININFWDGVQSTVDAAGVSIGQTGTFITGEVDDGDTSYVGPYSYHINSVLSYPMYFTLSLVFGGNGGYENSIPLLQQNVQQYFDLFDDPYALTTFVDNHDNPRFLCTSINPTANIVTLSNALAWTMLSFGIPIVYYGTEQGFDGCNTPDDREILWNTAFVTTNPLYSYIAQLNGIRQQFNETLPTASQIDIAITDDSYVIARTSSDGTQSCSVANASRIDCGNPTITATECQASGCCWAPTNAANTPWCFFKVYTPLYFLAVTNAGMGHGSPQVTLPVATFSNMFLVNALPPNDYIAIGSNLFVNITLTNGYPKVYTLASTPPTIPPTTPAPTSSSTPPPTTSSPTQGPTNNLTQTSTSTPTPKSSMSSSLATPSIMIVAGFVLLIALTQNMM